MSKRTKTKIVSDNTIKIRGLGNFIQNLREETAKAANKRPIKNPINLSRALKVAAALSTARATRISKTIAANAPSVIIFLHQVKGLCSRKTQRI